MNKANLKSYAPKARLDFIKAVTERANVLGISAAGTVPAQMRGDVAIIDGREWPAKAAGRRDELVARIKRHGFEQTMEAVAYTWFNRFAALRYMEIHDYLDHGWRVLSSRDGGLPEILRHASEVTLPGLNADRARDMQLAGNQDNELYKLLLVAQCNELSRVMPFLFESVDDETELLLPENLLRTDSIVAKLVESVPEEDWQEIEVIGWLYQFYISEKKDQVMGRVVKSEDIPAATQLFTPNWIVQYLVQNSVGRLWLMANPTSALASQWPYYIQPAEQSPEVQAQLDALIQTRIREDGDTLNPETITVLDPACGSGHILVVAYDVLKAIYLERGYQPRSIPRLILEKNLYGLDIDDRAGQLAAFALLMKARADDRRLFSNPLKLNVLRLLESKGLDLDELSAHLTPFGLQRSSIKSLLEIFEHAKAVGSLIQIQSNLSEQLPSISAALQAAERDGDLYAQQAAKDLLPLVWQACALGMQFDAIVANPPYMGGNGMNPFIKGFSKLTYPASKSDLFAMFIERGLSLCRKSGVTSMVTMQSWMFLSSFEVLRKRLLSSTTISSFVQIGYNSFPEINSKVAQACAFSIMPGRIEETLGVYVNLNSAHQSADKGEVFIRGRDQLTFLAAQETFSKIPGGPIAYWASAIVVRSFEKFKSLGEIAAPRLGMTSNDNDRFLRYWQEVSFKRIGLGFSRPLAKASGKKWFPYNKGGDTTRWYGCNTHVINWEEDGRDVLALSMALYGSPTRQIRSIGHYFQESATWSRISTDKLGVRYSPPGALFDCNGSSVFASKGLKQLIAYLCSNTSEYLLQHLNQTMMFQVGDVERIPVNPALLDSEEVLGLANELIGLAKLEWDSFEVSWDFETNPVVAAKVSASLRDAWAKFSEQKQQKISLVRALEEANNQIFIDAYGLDGELSPKVAESAVNIARPDREADCKRLLSFAIGCMLGRYSLDEPGLVYADAANLNFDPGRYASFPADADGILPLTDEHWFEDEAASRVLEFLRVVWPANTSEENLAWLAESLGTKGSETPDQTIRRYLADKFFKDHLQTYKKRPIYWLFSSGKQGAFQALVYLHRYNEGTLARMRAEYVMPLIAKVVSRLDMLDKDVAAASSAAARTKLQKQIESLRKKQIELQAYDEKLRYHADMRITLDLDDGVKVNYAKFGDLVAEGKAIAGGSDE